MPSKSYNVSVDVQVKRESSITEKPKQLTFSWDNLTLTAKGSNERKGLFGTKICRRDFVADKNILKNGELKENVRGC